MYHDVTEKDLCIPERSLNNFPKLESAHRQICNETLTNRYREKLQKTATKSCDSHIERCGKKRQDRDGVAHHCCRGVGRSKNRSVYTLDEGEQLQRPASLKESLPRAAPALVLSLPRPSCGWFVDETPASHCCPSVDCSFIQSKTKGPCIHFSTHNSFCRLLAFY